MTHSEQYAFLIEGLQLLAASPEEQLAVLPDYVCATDEVILNVSDACLLVPQLLAAGLVSAQAANTLNELDTYLERIPALDDAVPDRDVLYTHPFWSEARLLAQSALAILGVPRTPPRLTYVRYIPARST